MRTPQRQPWGRGRYFEPTEMDAEVVRRWVGPLIAESAAAIAATVVVVVAAVVAAAAACQMGRLAVGLAWVDSVPQEVVADRKSVCAAPRPPDKM